MSIMFTDQEIKAFVQERKVLPDNWNSKFKDRMNQGFKEHYQDITGEEENVFRIIVRKSDFSISNFSVILYHINKICIVFDAENTGGQGNPAPTV